MYTYRYIHICIYIYIYLFIYVCKAYVYICVCVHICARVFSTFALVYYTCILHQSIHICIYIERDRDRDRDRDIDIDIDTDMNWSICTLWARDRFLRSAQKCIVRHHFPLFGDCGSAGFPRSAATKGSQSFRIVQIESPLSSAYGVLKPSKTYKTYKTLKNRKTPKTLNPNNLSGLVSGPGCRNPRQLEGYMKHTLGCSLLGFGCRVY